MLRRLKRHSGRRQPVVVGQRDHFRHPQPQPHRLDERLAVARPQLRPVGPGVEPVVVRIDDAGRLVPQQHQRARHGGHVHRLPVAVQDQRRPLKYLAIMIYVLSISGVSERSRTATFWFTASRAETATPQTPYNCTSGRGGS